MIKIRCTYSEDDLVSLIPSFIGDVLEVAPERWSCEILALMDWFTLICLGCNGGGTSFIGLSAMDAL